ncbi:unnamed protein product [Cuscuta campestris]|uniref:NAC domain-containing protein n=1 Tax=Cuscuta campestris TaxID=132261 RepID=A0A484NNY2_9ASTE|nr:unnamed protein product [Cuscuta campestris]
MCREKGRGEEESCYFFTPRVRKYKKGQRPDRAARDGYWKSTGAEEAIKNSDGKTVGFKRSLVFYIGKSSSSSKDSVKTNWLMQEYRVDDSRLLSHRTHEHTMMLDNWVLCKLYKRVDSKASNITPVSNENADDDASEGEDGRETHHDDCMEETPTATAIPALETDGNEQTPAVEFELFDGLKDCLLVEQEEKAELSKKLQDLEKELTVSRTKLVESRQDLTSNRNVDALKQKIMKLRKENEVLKRQITYQIQG